MSPAPLRLAAFVSPHGFGHAARSAALLQELKDLRPNLELELTLWTSVPRWFFEESLDFPFDYKELACDVGLVQRSALEEDLPATVERLERFCAEAKGFHLGEIRKQLRDTGAHAVVCDIAPLGLLAAHEAGVPSILVENFTWDWIYEPLVAAEPRLEPWVGRLRELFALADLRIRAEPVCGPPPAQRAATSAPASASPGPVSFFPSMKDFSSCSSSSSSNSASSGTSIRVPPIARRPKAARAETRARLGVAADRPLVLVSFGGVAHRFEALQRWRAPPEIDFVVPGGAEVETRRGNWTLLPHHSPVYHPDLVAAADVVVGKLGYSTVTEAVAAGTRYAYLPRPGFRESAVLERFVQERLPALELDASEFDAGRWVDRLPALLARPRPLPDRDAGATVAAAAVARFLESGHR